VQICEQYVYSQNKQGVFMKPATTVQQQIQILLSRGCIIEDEKFAEYILSHINYYRLTAYLLPYKSDDIYSYTEKIKFETIYKVYEFDRKMRNIIFVAIEEIEINIRMNISYYFAHKYGANGYLNPNNYDNKYDFNKFNEKINECLKNNSNTLFVKHHNKKYNGEFPIWVLIETFTFGMLTFFYRGLKITDRQKLATIMFHTTHSNVSSWFRCCSDLRNICAHYGRLYYHCFSAIPANILCLDKNNERSLFGAISVLKMLCYDKNKWNKEIFNEIGKLLEEYKNDIVLDFIGFPNNWKDKLRF
jgi:abortive infection bacteriophage resistance protein